MTVKYRRPLNSEQLSILTWLYRFRFSTSKQLSDTLHKPSNKTIQNKLLRLEQQALIGKRYTASYRLAGRPAEYYLTQKGAHALSESFRLHGDKDKDPKTLSPSVVKALYKNKTVSESFLRHCLHVVDAALILTLVYGDNLRLFPQADMVPYETFPTWRPDLFLSLRSTKGVHRYYLDIWDETKPFFVSVRKARNYLSDSENGNWPDNLPYPCIVMLCHDEKSQKKLSRQIIAALDDANSDIVFATTTLGKLQSATKPSDRLWNRIALDEDVTQVSLKNLSPQQTP